MTSLEEQLNSMVSDLDVMRSKIENHRTQLYAHTDQLSYLTKHVREYGGGGGGAAGKKDDNITDAFSFLSATEIDDAASTQSGPSPIWFVVSWLYVPTFILIKGLWVLISPLIHTYRWLSIFHTGFASFSSLLIFSSSSSSFSDSGAGGGGGAGGVSAASGKGGDGRGGGVGGAGGDFLRRGDGGDSAGGGPRGADGSAGGLLHTPMSDGSLFGSTSRERRRAASNSLAMINNDAYFYSNVAKDFSRASSNPTHDFANDLMEELEAL